MKVIASLMSLANTAVIPAEIIDVIRIDETAIFIGSIDEYFTA